MSTWTEYRIWVDGYAASKDEAEMRTLRKKINKLAKKYGVGLVVTLEAHQVTDGFDRELYEGMG